MKARAALMVALLACAWSVAGPAVGAHAQQPTCSQFANQAQAQAAYRSNPTFYAPLDGDHDGIACEALPCPCDRNPVVFVTNTPTPRPPTTTPLPPSPTSTPRPLPTNTP